MASKKIKESAPTAELSKVPSWILLGFVVGGLFVFLLRREYIVVEASSPTMVSAEIPNPALSKPSITERKGQPSLSAIEDVWAEWGHYAIWDDDLTQVALWNTEFSAFSDCFEVTRHGDQVYFRSIARLTLPVVERGLGTQSPLQFTSPAVYPKRR